MAGDVSGGGRAITVDVWSDIMCPFCYMGDTLLAQAIERFPHASAVSVRHHSYQLMPELSRDRPVDLIDLLVEQRGYPRDRVESMHAGITERAESLGLDYRLDRAVTVNSRDAHRLSYFAATGGLQNEMVHRLFRAYFTDGLNIADHSALADMAAEIGLDRDEALEALKSGRHDDDVEADLRQARELGISGVPFFVLDGKYAVSGAQDADVFLKALDTAWGGD
ncbi:DsbA family oxidoreductase [Glycomyces harbinensis]|uniref:Predicted dithiol-disulfide isomerase, DsbA family n=1 Tax=Glycomyces harbinensis TaxID=58114 RepID=A0A1G6T4G8_9ACTN|nr:DsbA family oxidoreductase [Glycomyces harbinensis]SDD24042.1 Predicted dithiol-disulfide isomerase, DsbA family [Glycomyces harbinensis]